MAKKKHRNSATATPTREQPRQQRKTSNGTGNPPPQQQRRTRKRTSRKNSYWLIGGILACCVLVIGTFIYLANSQSSAGIIGPTDPIVLKTVTTVKPSLLAQVQTGGVQNQLQSIKGQQPLVGPDGKPELFYYGAEFCPYCAAQRWPMVIALSRFGTFSQLPETISSGTDVSPNTATFTFVNSKYTSQYIDFAPLEAEDRDQKALQTPTADEQQILQQFKVTGFPFLDIANQYQIAQQFYDPEMLAGLSQKDIASKLSDPSSKITQNILGSANYLTAAICDATQEQPASVCKADPIPAVSQLLTLSPSAPGNSQAVALAGSFELDIRRQEG